MRADSRESFRQFSSTNINSRQTSRTSSREFIKSESKKEKTLVDSHENLSEFDESTRESMGVHEYFRPNESDSCLRLGQVLQDVMPVGKFGLISSPIRQ